MRIIVKTLLEMDIPCESYDDIPLVEFNSIDDVQNKDKLLDYFEYHKYHMYGIRCIDSSAILSYVINNNNHILEGYHKTLVAMDMLKDYIKNHDIIVTESNYYEVKLEISEEEFLTQLKAIYNNEASSLDDKKLELKIVSEKIEWYKKKADRFGYDYSKPISHYEELLKKFE